MQYITCRSHVVLSLLEATACKGSHCGCPPVSGGRSQPAVPIRTGRAPLRQLRDSLTNATTSSHRHFRGDGTKTITTVLVDVSRMCSKYFSQKCVCRVCALGAARTYNARESTDDRPYAASLHTSVLVVQGAHSREGVPLPDLRPS